MKKTMMKLIAAITAALTVIITPAVALAAPANFPDYGSFQGTLEKNRKEALLKEMKSQTIDVYLMQNGWYVTKQSILYGRPIIGVDKEGNWILGNWTKLDDREDICKGTVTAFTVPGNYAQFAYSVDIVWGTDWPYSDIFWRDTNTQVHEITIVTSGTTHNVCVGIFVNGIKNRNRVVLLDDCDAHRQWHP